MENKKIVIVGHGGVGSNAELIRRLTEKHNTNDIIILDNENNNYDEFELAGLKLSDEQKERLRQLGIEKEFIQVTLNPSVVGERDKSMLKALMDDFCNEYKEVNVKKSKKNKPWEKKRFWE